MLRLRAAAPAARSAAKRAPHTLLRLRAAAPAARAAARGGVLLLAAACLFRASSALPFPQLTSAEIASMQASIVSTLNLSLTYGSVCNTGCAAAHVVGALVRLPFHDATGGGAVAGVPGGANGCIDATAGDNAGLNETMALLDVARAPYADKISRADFFVLGGNTAVKLASTYSAAVFSNQANAAGMDKTAGALVLPFRPGRIDLPSCVGADAAFLPNASFTWPSLAALFGGRFGMSTEEIVAIMGAHALGRMSTDENAPTNGVWAGFASSFSSMYYKKLVGVGWAKDATKADVWESAGGALQFLRPDVEIALTTTSSGPPSQGCVNFNIVQNQLNNCPLTPGAAASSAFAANQTAWFVAYARAWQKMTEYLYTPDADGTYLASFSQSSPSASPSASPSPSAAWATPASSSAAPSASASPAIASASVSASAAASATASISPSKSLVTSASVAATVSPTASASKAASRSTSASPQGSPSRSASGSLAPTASTTMSRASSATHTATISASSTASSSATATSTSTPSGSSAVSVSVAASRTVSASTSPSLSASASPSMSVAGSVSASATCTATISPSLSASSSATATSTSSSSESSAVSVSTAASPTASSSSSPSTAGSVSASASHTASISPSPTASASATASSASSPSVSSAATSSAAASSTVSPSVSSSPSASASSVATSSTSPSPTSSAEASPSAAASASGSESASASVSRSGSESPSVSPAPSVSSSSSGSQSTARSSSATPSPSASPVSSPTASGSATASPSSTPTPSGSSLPPTAVQFLLVVSFSLPSDTTAVQACSAAVQQSVYVAVVGAAADAGNVSRAVVTCTVTAAARQLAATAQQAPPRSLSGGAVAVFSIRLSASGGVQAVSDALAALSATSFGATTSALANATGALASAFTVSVGAATTSCANGGDACTLPAAGGAGAGGGGGLSTGAIAGIAVAAAVVAAGIIAAIAIFGLRRGWCGGGGGARAPANGAAPPPLDGAAKPDGAAPRNPANYDVYRSSQVASGGNSAA